MQYLKCMWQGKNISTLQSTNTWVNQSFWNFLIHFDVFNKTIEKIFIHIILYKINKSLLCHVRTCVIKQICAGYTFLWWSTITVLQCAKRWAQCIIRPNRTDTHLCTSAHMSIRIVESPLRRNEDLWILDSSSSFRSKV